MFFKNTFSTSMDENLRQIKEHANWAVFILNNAGYRAGYSLEGISEIERFLEQDNTDRILKSAQNRIFYALCCCLGEAAIWNYGGEWVIESPEDANHYVLLNNNKKYFPFAVCMKKKEAPESISIYETFKLLA